MACSPCLLASSSAHVPLENCLHFLEICVDCLRPDQPLPDLSVVIGAGPGPVSQSVMDSEGTGDLELDQWSTRFRISLEFREKPSGHWEEWLPGAAGGLSAALLEQVHLRLKRAQN